MGIDIEIFAERKQPDGRWDLFDPPVKNGESYNHSGARFIPDCFYDGRNFSLFAILANVRNGMRTEEPFNTIADLRGVPNDMSPAGRAFYDSESCDDATW